MHQVNLQNSLIKLRREENRKKAKRFSLKRNNNVPVIALAIASAIQFPFKPLVERLFGQGSALAEEKRREKEKKNHR